MKTLTEELLKTIKFYGADELRAIEIVEDIVESIKEYNTKVVGEDEEVKLLPKMKDEMVSFETTKTALRNDLRAEIRTKQKELL